MTAVDLIAIGIGLVSAGLIALHQIGRIEADPNRWADRPADERDTT